MMFGAWNALPALKNPPRVFPVNPTKPLLRTDLNADPDTPRVKVDFDNNDIETVHCAPVTISARITGNVPALAAPSEPHSTRRPSTFDRPPRSIRTPRKSRGTSLAPLQSAAQGDQPGRRPPLEPPHPPRSRAAHPPEDIPPAPRARPPAAASTPGRDCRRHRAHGTADYCASARAHLPLLPTSRRHRKRIRAPVEITRAKRYPLARIVADPHRSRTIGIRAREPAPIEWITG